jgi:hypothetical protein
LVCGRIVATAFRPRFSAEKMKTTHVLSKSDASRGVDGIVPLSVPSGGTPLAQPAAGCRRHVAGLRIKGEIDSPKGIDSRPN